MTPLDQAIAHYIEARSEVGHWQVLCTDYMKTHGRRGHSKLFDMLARRRFAHHHFHFARCHLVDALEQ